MSDSNAANAHCDSALRGATAAGLLMTVVIGAPTNPQAAPPVEIPAQFEDAPAIILEDSAEWIWPTERKSRLHSRQRILIRDSRAFDLADQEIIYDGVKGRMAGFSARTVLGNGRVIKVTDSLIHDSILFKDEDSETRVLRFTFPAVEQGAVLEWEYTQHEKKSFPLMMWKVQREVPVLESRLRATIEPPLDAYVQIQAASRVDGTAYCETSVGDDRKGLHLLLLCKNVPGARQEDFAPPRADRELYYDVYWGAKEWSVSGSWWRNKSKYVHKLVNEFLEGNTNVRSRARQLVDSTAADREKIDAVYRFVRDELGPDDHAGPTERQPKNVDEVLERGTADGDELTLLTLALIRAVGLSADPVLANDRSVQSLAYDMNSILQANHLMLRVLVDGSFSYLDPSCRFCPAGVPDWRYCGTDETALLVGPSRLAWVSIGEIPAEHNSELRKETISIAGDGHARVEGQVVFGAQYDVERRRRWRHMSEAARQEDFLSGFSRQYESVQVEFSDIDKPFEPLNVEYSIENVELPATRDGRLLVRPTDSISKEIGIPVADDRLHPIWFPFRYSRQFETTFLIPPGFAPSGAPDPGVVDGPGMQFRYAWEAGERPEELVWVGQLTVDRTIIPASEYEDAKNFYIELRRALRGGAVLERAGPASKEQQNAAL